MGVADALGEQLRALADAATAVASGIDAGGAARVAAAPAAEARAAYAREVHAAFCAKLDGGGTGVVQHVAALVEQAVSEDNLARMYEGWTPWI